jgi:hypothetical protein
MGGTNAQFSTGTVSPAHAFVARNYTVRSSRKLSIIQKFATGKQEQVRPFRAINQGPGGERVRWQVLEIVGKKLR